MTPEVTLNLQIAKPTTSRLSRVAIASTRILLGVLFFVSGLNGLFHVLPEPNPQLPVGAAAFAGALMATGYMFPLIMGTQLVVGTLLLANRFVPLALTLLAPFMVNSIAFHLFLEPSGRPMAFIVLALQLFLVWKYRRSYTALLTSRAAQA
jgi:uncharacterized membrane protein YphA (DoxX/SURF4 family)